MGDNHLEQIERDLREQWSKFRTEPEVMFCGASFGIVAVRREFRTEPEVMFCGASFGIVAVRRDALTLIEFDAEDNPYESRDCTPDEIAQFKKEFARVLK